MNRGTGYSWITICLGMKGLSKGRMQLIYSSALTSRGYGAFRINKSAESVQRCKKLFQCEGSSLPPDRS